MTAALVTVFGSDQLIERTGRTDRSLRPLLHALTTLPTWTTTRLPGDAELALVAKMVTLLVAVGVLAWCIAAAGSRSTAFLAGWAALVLSGALAGLVFLEVAGLFPTGAGGATRGLPAIVRAINSGAAFGLYTGWLVGLAIALALPRARQARRARPPRKASISQLPKPPQRPNRPLQALPDAPPAPPSGWPPRPRIGTNLPNPAWTAAGLHQERTREPVSER